MLDLFKNIFGQSDHAGPRLPESLIGDAIERTVDGTDPRVRIVSGYAKTLRRPVIHAIKYVIDLVDNFPQPVTVSKVSLSDNPAFSALLYSEERMEQIFSRDIALREFRTENPLATGLVSALLVAQRTEKHGFGTAQVGEQVLSDVPRTTVSFDQHRLLEPAASEQETRRLLKFRAFDYLVSIALAQVTERKEERETLDNRKALLRSKLAIVRRGNSFSQHTATDEHAKLQASLDDIEQKLSALGPVEGRLEDTLAVTVEILADARRHFWLKDKVDYLDRLYVLHDKAEQSAPGTNFQELQDSEGRQATVLLVNIPLH
jgi:hypothetical protein